MPPVELNFKFTNEAQRLFVENTKRNSCFNGGYGNGKTFGACIKSLLLLTKFPKYRMAIGRLRANELRNTTMATFFKACPEALYDSSFGGSRSDNLGKLRLINGSEVLWMHFADQDLTSLRSLEINSCFLDQAEEISEEVYLHLDSRVGRWDMAEVPAELLAMNKNWPVNALTGKPKVPSYNMLACNPADEGELHWIWQRYHPDSILWQEEFKDSHYYIEAASYTNIALDAETLKAMESRDPEWKSRFIEGKWGKSGGTVHRVLPDSILEVDKDFVEMLKTRASIYRSYDHGGTTPACCLWTASYKGVYIVFQEYYAANKLISEHREAINELTGKLPIVYSVADPDIFVKRSQKYGAFWSVAEEYADRSIDAPPVIWNPADNNEIGTRNRISELLRINANIKHPITGVAGAPRLYFIKRTPSVPMGCYHTIRETQAQKYKVAGSVNGKNIYLDERDEAVSDHSYDALRYFVAIHAKFPKDPVRKPSSRSFLGIKNQIKAHNLYYGTRLYSPGGLPTR